MTASVYASIRASNGLHAVLEGRNVGEAGKEIIDSRLSSQVSGIRVDVAANTARIKA